MPDQSETTILPGLRTRDTEGEECPSRHILAIDSIDSGLIIAGPCSPWIWENELLGEPTGDDLSHEETQREEPAPTPILAWLPWQSRGCEHGLKRHKIAKNGYVYEINDRPTAPRRKSKAVSTRQWEGR
jgi:hypothetical protein